MRQGLALVFDEVLFGPGVAYTGQEMNGLLAVQDQMAIQVIVDNVQLSVAGGPPTVSVWLQTSGNGENWATKNLVPEVQSFFILEGQTNVSPYSADSGVLPTLRYARFKVAVESSVVGQTLTAHIKILVTCRDLGGEVVTAPIKPSHAATPHAAPDKNEMENLHAYHPPENKNDKAPPV